MVLWLLISEKIRSELSEGIDGTIGVGAVMAVGVSIGEYVIWEIITAGVGVGRGGVIVGFGVGICVGITSEGVGVQVKGGTDEVFGVLVSIKESTEEGTEEG